MKSRIRNRIKQFLKSEDGRVGIKTPLALGIASGNLLLAQVIFADNHESTNYECYTSSDCESGETCTFTLDKSNGQTEWSSECVEGS